MNIPALSTLALLVLLLTSVFSSAIADGYHFVTIHFPESVQTEAYGINARGAVVGMYIDGDGEQHGFLLKNGKYTSIDVPDALITLTARAINARGEILGSFLDHDDVQHIYILSNGIFTKTTHPGAIRTQAGGINNAGDITGQWWNKDDKSRGYIRQNGKWINIMGPEGTGEVHVRMVQDNGRVAVGHFWSKVDGGVRGFIRHASGKYEIIEYPGGLAVPCSGIRWINQRGDMVGGFARIGPSDECHPPFKDEHAFLLRNGKFTNIDFPGSPSTQPFAINDDGVIIGRYTGPDGRVYGFRATPNP